MIRYFNVILNKTCYLISRLKKEKKNDENYSSKETKLMS